MSDAVTSAVKDARYRNSFGRAGGYLPQSRAAADAWLAEFADRARGRKEEHVPSVAALAELINTDAVIKQQVNEMIEQVPETERHVTDIDHLLICLDEITGTAPKYEWDPAKRVFFPMSTLFVHMMATDGGWNVFRNRAFNDKIAGVLRAWCGFLDTEESCTYLNEGENGWFSQPAYEQNKLYEFAIDRTKEHWGFTSYNDFFHRRLAEGARPIGGTGDPKAILSANDGKVVRYRRNVKHDDQFWLKGQPYSLVDMLNNSPYTNQFVNGDVFHTFLSGADYHRWHSPVDGKIVAKENVPGYYFAELQSMGDDATAGTHSQCYGASVNTRGLVFIQSTSPDIGMVCVMPIGITEISSVTHTVEKDQVVKKGQELGYFSYGGSSMCLIFEPGKVDAFTAPQNETGDADDGAPVFVNAQIARAR